MAVKLDALLEKFASACHYINQTVPVQIANSVRIHQLVYRDVRTLFGLSANQAARAIARVAANRKTARDKDTLIKTARKGEALPLCTDHGRSYTPGYQADAPCTKFDPAGANKLLDQDGWVKGADGYRTKDGKKLEFKYTTTSGKPWRQDDELIIQSGLKDIGIKINIDIIRY